MEVREKSNLFQTGNPGQICSCLRISYTKYIKVCPKLHELHKVCPKYSALTGLASEDMNDINAV